jgi:hypothetical protein
VHAEVAALQRLRPQARSKRLTTVDLLVVRVLASGALANSRPCEVRGKGWLILHLMT